MDNLDVKLIGPGLWHMIHLLALNAVTDVSKKSFILTINTLCDNFICESCKPHFRKFIDDHSFNHYWNIQYKKEGDYGFFKWSWELHNAVNKRIGLQTFAFEDALFKYKNYVCHDCNKIDPILVKVKESVKPVFNLISYY